MDLGIRGKRALLTGAGRGLGRSIALCLAQEGVKVAIAARSSDDVNSAVEEVGGKSKGHYGLAIDLVEDGAPRKLVSRVLGEFGDVDILVHNLGGTLDVTDPFCSLEEWRHLWRFNMEVSIELNLLLLPDMLSRQWGRVVFVSSIAAMENHGPVPYCSIKAAITAYARSMGRFVAPKGVVITAVLPGAVLTHGGYWHTASTERPEHVDKYLKERMAIQRFGRPEEIGNLVTFLCSKQASFCIGSIVPADGGQGRSYFGY